MRRNRRKIEGKQDTAEDQDVKRAKLEDAGKQDLQMEDVSQPTAEPTEYSKKVYSADDVSEWKA